MRLIDGVIKLFGVDLGTNFKEGLEEFEIQIESSSFVVPNGDELRSAFEILGVYGLTFLSIKFDGGESIILGSGSMDIEAFVADLKQQMNFDPTSFELKLTVGKENCYEFIPVFNTSALVQYLTALRLKYMLSRLWNKFGPSKSLTICLFDGDGIDVKSKTIFIRSNDNMNQMAKNGWSKEHSERSDQIKEYCHFENSSELGFVPEDFRFESVGNCPMSLLDLFNRLTGLFSIVCLFDNTRINENDLWYRLNGFKVKSGTISLDEIDVSTVSKYYEVYSWVYNEGNLADKIGLARNLLSVHFDDGPKLGLRGEPGKAIKSAYDIYLKQNIKQYIDVRTKVTDQLVDLSEKAGKIADNFASNFQKSVIGLTSLFASIIVTKILTGKDGQEIFDSKSGGLSLAFLVIGFIYFLGSIVDLNHEKKRFEQRYNDMKARFKDLLEDGDIEKILDSDKTHKNDLKYIGKKFGLVCWVWVSALAILTSVIIYLTNWHSSTPPPFIKPIVLAGLINL